MSTNWSGGSSYVPTMSPTSPVSPTSAGSSPSLSMRQFGSTIAGMASKAMNVLTSAPAPSSPTYGGGVRGDKFPDMASIYASSSAPAAQPVASSTSYLPSSSGLSSTSGTPGTDSLNQRQFAAFTPPQTS